MVLIATVCGCDQRNTQDDTTISDQPADDGRFADGVAALKEHYTQIKEAFALEDSEKALEMAHEPLHEVGHTLNALSDLTANAELPTEDSETAKESIKTMFTCYANIDGAVHHGETPDYEVESDKLDEAMAALEAVLARKQK